ncbi:MAG: amine oxidase, partial [Desulfovibrio sp.]
METITYLIIGAGPTGLGAGHRLKELGIDDFLLLERNPYVGGLSASFTDSKGFTWDIGGHVAFSHYEYYDKLLDHLLGQDWLEHQRIARVRMADTWIPYPFQNNIRHLPPELRWECVRGLLPEHRPQDLPTNFLEWFSYVFGPGIARLFMQPYNFKVWATPPELMAYHWISERVSVIDLERVLKNLALETDDVGWGPNNTFRFPLKGGTGEIYRRMAEPFLDRIRLNAGVASIDPQAKTLRLEDGQELAYAKLLNTGPLDRLILDLLNCESNDLRRAAGDLAHNSVYVAGVGVKGMREDPTCWMYFPE